jgi:hypothetical protein
MQQFGKQTKRVPKTLYNTQSFESWLHYFLSRQVIEENLQATFLRNPPAFGDDMHDFHDSPAWKSLREFMKTKYHLAFGLYVIDSILIQTKLLVSLFIFIFIV